MLSDGAGPESDRAIAAPRWIAVERCPIDPLNMSSSPVSCKSQVAISSKPRGSHVCRHVCRDVWCGGWWMDGRGWAPRNSSWSERLGTSRKGRRGHAAAVSQRPVDPKRRWRVPVSQFKLSTGFCCWICRFAGSSRKCLNPESTGGEQPGALQQIPAPGTTGGFSGRTVRRRKDTVRVVQPTPFSEQVGVLFLGHGMRPISRSAVLALIPPIPALPARECCNAQHKFNVSSRDRFF